MQHVVPSIPPSLKRGGAGPWYAHRWPWLLMLGPAIVVVAGVITGWLAYTRQDAMVVDDYYKRGKAINQDLRRDRAASAQQLSMELSYNPAAATLGGVLRAAGQPLAGPLQISFTHPTQPAKDIGLLVRADQQGRFSVALPMLERAHWQVLVEGGQRGWRLARSWSWPQQQALKIEADPEAASE